MENLYLNFIKTAFRPEEVVKKQIKNQKTYWFEQLILFFFLVFIVKFFSMYLMMEFPPIDVAIISGIIIGVCLGIFILVLLVVEYIIYRLINNKEMTSAIFSK